jgi:hypothetical protein
MRMITGATFDPAHRMLYVAVRFATSTGPSGQHLVYAYHVS